jgi:hypothetical protein
VPKTTRQKCNFRVERTMVGPLLAAMPKALGLRSRQGSRRQRNEPTAKAQAWMALPPRHPKSAPVGIPVRRKCAHSPAPLRVSCQAESVKRDRKGRRVKPAPPRSPKRSAPRGDIQPDAGELKPPISKRRNRSTQEELVEGPAACLDHRAAGFQFSDQISCSDQY